MFNLLSLTGLAPSGRRSRRAALLVVSLAAGGCGGGGGGSAPPATFAVGGTVGGLTAAGLVLANGADTVSLAAGATTFTFPRMLTAGASYAVSVQTQPAGISCAVSAGSGTVGSAPVTSVRVDCAASAYTVGGSITGLTAAGLVLSNGSDAVAPDANATTFTFAPVAPGTAYDVTLRMQPPGLTCQVANASGTVVASSITDVSVSCGSRPWSWTGGSNIGKAAGVYGTVGIADPANVPGARNGANSWSDGAGNFWLFGGYAYDSAGALDDVNDLWKYNPATAQWTWVGGSSTIASAGAYGMQGVPSGANVPSARDGAALWTDSSGIVWLFGGEGYDSVGTYGSLQDLWRYDPSNGEWTWIGGAAAANGAGSYGTQGAAAGTNLPGARDHAATWRDGAGNFWLFGGYGRDAGSAAPIELGDLWMFNPSTTQWTWVGGSSTGNGPGSYGTRGVAAASNAPGARDSAATWIDAQGAVWMYGGFGYDAAGASAMALSDLWTFDPTSVQWTWAGGPSVGNAPGVYGTQGTAAAGNQPGARFGAVSWLDSVGNFWLLGGDGYDAAGGAIGRLNDLWEYTPATGSWTWVGGSSAANAGGIYGTVGVAASANAPGGRYDASGWIDTLGHLWLFGGLGFDSVGAAETELNDLWQY
jgi:N-acetylneuraminic acid mutarotase